jgi:hypothetical protein
MQHLVTRQWSVGRTAGTTSGCIFQPTLGLRSILFMASEAHDNAADAVRDTAFDLGAQAERPVLLLDLAIPGNRHYRSFYQSGLLAPHRTAAVGGITDFAVLNFARLLRGNLFVSRVTPDPAAFSDITWRVAAREGLRRLQHLFGAVVIAAPELAVSDAGLRMAPEVDGVVLVLRSGATNVAEARAMRDRVLRTGAQILGTVMTHCPRHASRASSAPQPA